MTATVQSITSATEPTLEEIERRIEENSRAWIERGRLLRHIRDAKLYRTSIPGANEPRYQTFEAYCEERWEMSRERGRQLMNAVDLVAKMPTNVGVLPIRESHVRPLFDLDSDEHRIDVWRTVVETYKTIRAKDVQAEVNKKKSALEKDWYTLDEWLALDADQQRESLTRSLAGTLNKQDNNSIEWAQWSWNPITGCKHDCSYCYARDIAQRFYPQGFEPSIHPNRLRSPINHQPPEKAAKDTAHRNVFTGSMADIFGRWVPDEWIKAVFNTVRDSPQWNFLFLTKFPKRMVDFDYPENAWLGTSVDCQARVKAAESAFANVKSGTRWLSIEPMLEPLKFDHLEHFDWVVIGGASKSTQTPAWVPPLDWIVDLWTQAREAGCAIYVKDNCGMSDDLRVREFPWEEWAPKELPKELRYLPSIG